jgi:hypothetical protein
MVLGDNRIDKRRKDGETIHRFSGLCAKFTNASGEFRLPLAEAVFRSETPKRSRASR